jgi:hypothetical protein
MNNRLKKHSQRKSMAADIGEIYGITGENLGQATRTAKQSRVQPFRPPGRPLIMTPEEERAVCDHIIQQDRDRKWLTKGQTRKWIEETMHCSRSYVWLARFLDRDADTVIRNPVTPQGDPRLQFPTAWLDCHIALNAKVIPLACCELIYNINETGFLD